MTKSSPSRRERRVGRPPIDDEFVVDLAASLKIAWGLSERKAIDLAVALSEARPTKPTKLPRGAKGRRGWLASYETVTDPRYGQRTPGRAGARSYGASSKSSERWRNV
jgi:hypothetical protein